MGKDESEMKKVIEKAKASTETLKKSAKEFQRELHKTIGSSLIAAFGLVIGLAWKEVVDTYILRFISPEQSKLLTAIVITVLAVAAIMIISKILTNEDENSNKA